MQLEVHSLEAVPFWCGVGLEIVKADDLRVGVGC